MRNTFHIASLCQHIIRSILQPDLLLHITLCCHITPMGYVSRHSQVVHSCMCMFHLSCYNFPSANQSCHRCYGALPASLISFYLTSKGVHCTLRTFSASISHELVLQRRRPGILKTHTVLRLQRRHITRRQIEFLQGIRYVQLHPFR